MRQIYAFIVAQAILLYPKCTILHYFLLAICFWIHLITILVIVGCEELGFFIVHCLCLYAYRHQSSVLRLGMHHILEARDILCFHFSFWLHGHAFVARISYSCRHGVTIVFSYPMLDSGLSLFDTKEHCPHSLAYATYLPCCSALVFSSSYCYLLGSCPIFPLQS